MCLPANIQTLQLLQFIWAYIYFDSTGCALLTHSASYINGYISDTLATISDFLVAKLK